MSDATTSAVESGWYLVHTYQQANNQFEEGQTGWVLNIGAKVPCGDVDQFELDQKLLLEFNTAEKLIACVSLNIADLSDTIGKFGGAFF